MSGAFDSIRRGLRQAVAHQGGKGRGVKVYQPQSVNVKRIRGRTGLTQSDFAATFGIGLGTLRHWEQGDRTPRGATLVLLNIIERDPTAVLKALQVKRKTPARTAHKGARRTAQNHGGKGGGKGKDGGKVVDPSPM
ncbi:MAG: helix-turn-helix domain-containing protein [Betaproteobacteria bacterium]|nr:helix-turn-helix domain-containing protein [Betaproteobacteria bacterium]